MIKLLAEVKENELPLVGSKAYNQAWLWQKKFNVPPGLVLPVTTFTNFLKAQNLLEKLSLLDAQPTLAADIACEIAQAELPATLKQELTDKCAQAFAALQVESFAVRSSALGEDSAAHSFAGIHRTLLAVPATQLPQAICACWASAFSEPAIRYRQEHGIPLAQISIAVLIQPLLVATTAGVAFSLDPVSGNRDQIVINATYGLGELLVSGQVEPDFYRLAKDSPPTLIEQKLGGKKEQLTLQNHQLVCLTTPTALCLAPSLTPAALSTLANEVSRLEKLFTTPQDVEWAYVGEQLFILQSRPITTAAQQSSTSFEWSRMNFREILPELPSPFSVGIMELSEINFANYYQTLGFKIKDLRPVLKIIYGRPYFNLTLFKYATESTGFPLDFMLRSIGHGEELSTQPDYRINYRKMLASWPIVLRSVIKQSRLKSMLASFLTLTERELAVINGIDVAVIDKVELINQWESRRAYFYQFLAHAITISSAINSTALMLLRNLQSITSEAENFINTQIAIGEKNISAQQGLDLHHLAELAREETPCRNYFISTREEFGDYVSALANTNFLREFEKFLHHYGHRGIHETDIAQPRYGEDPSYLLFTIQHMVNMSPFSTAKELCAQQEKEAEQAWQILAEKLRAKTIFAPLKLHFLRKQLQRLKGLFALRERVRFEGIRVITAARHLHLKFATRLQKEGYITQQEDYFMLQPQDLIAAANRREFHQLQTIIEQRKVRHSFHQKLHLPNLLCDAEIATIPNHTPYIKKQERQQFYGLAVSPGIIEAEVLIIESPLHFTKMKPGRILVAPATDPAWTPLFTLAAGVIVEIGGVLSHGSIVAREYGLPAVVNIPHITHILRDGDRVLLNGNQGTVQIL